LGADSSNSLQLLVPDVKNGSTSSGGGSGVGGGNDGNTGGATTTVTPALSTMLALFATLIYTLF